MKSRRSSALRSIVCTLLLGALCLSVMSLSSVAAELERPRGVPADVIDGNLNVAVMELVEDCETVRLALGAAWEDAYDCRVLSDYLAPWEPAEEAGERAEALLRRGAGMYELLCCVDEGIISLKFARDSKRIDKLEPEIDFWRNELALAAAEVVAYADDAAALRGELAAWLGAAAEERQISRGRIEPLSWEDPGREAWRREGLRVGARLSLTPDPESAARWWLETTDLEPGYMVTKLRTLGHEFFSSDQPLAAWGNRCTGPGQYDWKRLRQVVGMVKKRRGGFLLELPTMRLPLRNEDLEEARREAIRRHRATVPQEYKPLPRHLATDLEAGFVGIDREGHRHLAGGVQLFNPRVAEGYGEYLRALAAELKRRRLYETIAAVHLESGDWAALPGSVDYSDRTRTRWQEFLAERYDGDIELLNRRADTDYGSFEEIEIPRRRLDPRAKDDWQEFTRETGKDDARSWGRYLRKKYGDDAAIREEFGTDYREGYRRRRPFDYPPVIKTDYLHFRRAWVADYLRIKRRLVRAAFPDKLIIAEMRQFGDHDGIAGRSEKKWGGFLGDDIAQWSGTGMHNDRREFMIRSVEPIGFGTRPSDSIESVFRDYLWLNFTIPGNLVRYFYAWVSHGYMDYQAHWHSITNVWMTNRLINRLGPTVANTRPSHQRIGMVLPRGTFDLHAGTVYYGYMGWDWYLHAAKLPYTRIDEDDVREGKLGDYEDLEYLILPDHTQAMEETVAGEIREWVERGGTLIASRMPGTTDIYGRELDRPRLAEVFGASVDGVVSEAVAGTPLTVTIPRGIFSGGNATETDRRPDFQTLAPEEDTKVLARYAGGAPAITVRPHGRGRAVLMGYPFGREGVVADRTSIGFQRTYTGFVREPQVVNRTAWLRGFFLDTLGHDPDYACEYAEVGRWKGKEAQALGLSLPKGPTEDPGSWLYIRNFGDPRPGHELEVEREDTDIAIRFFPRHREGVATRYLGISTRDVHYISPRATVQMYLAPHVYHVRINNPRIRAIWDVARDVPVGFTRDEDGVSLTVSVPSGHLMMLAVSETPSIDLFPEGESPARTPGDLLARTRELAGGTEPPEVAILRSREIEPWFDTLDEPLPEGGEKPEVIISYGRRENRAAAEKLAGFLQEQYDANAKTVRQVAEISKVRQERRHRWVHMVENRDAPMIYIGTEWTNNDLALGASYWNWGNTWGPRVPFTSSYRWPGEGRAVVGLSRPFALHRSGRLVGGRHWGGHGIHPVRRDSRLLRRKLHVAANGEDALAAVEALMEAVSKP